MKGRAPHARGARPRVFFRPREYSRRVQIAERLELPDRTRFRKSYHLQGASMFLAYIDPVSGSVRLHGRRPGEMNWPVYRRRAVLVDQRPVLFEGSVVDSSTPNTNMTLLT